MRYLNELRALKKYNNRHFRQNGTTNLHSPKFAYICSLIPEDTNDGQKDIDKDNGSLGIVIGIAPAGGCPAETRAGSSEDAAVSAVRNRGRGHIVYGRADAVANFIAPPQRQGMAPLLQAGVEFQQDLPLRARGENADTPDRQHLHRGRTRQTQERKIREQGAEGVVQCFRTADAQHDRHAGTASDEAHRQGGRQVILLYHKGLQERNRSRILAGRGQIVRFRPEKAL